MKTLMIRRNSQWCSQIRIQHSSRIWNATKYRETLIEQQCFYMRQPNKPTWERGVFYQYGRSPRSLCMYMLRWLNWYSIGLENRHPATVSEFESRAQRLKAIGVMLSRLALTQQIAVQFCYRLLYFRISIGQSAWLRTTRLQVRILSEVLIQPCGVMVSTCDFGSHDEGSIPFRVVFSQCISVGRESV